MRICYIKIIANKIYKKPHDLNSYWLYSHIRPEMVVGFGPNAFTTI